MGVKGWVGFWHSRRFSGWERALVLFMGGAVGGGRTCGSVEDNFGVFPCLILY